MTPAAPAQPSFVDSVGGSTGFAAATGETAPRVAAAQLSATGAVESALQISDLQAAQSQGAQSAVNLRFNVAGENLSVRVALQAGQVHTQFNTDSGELRDVLAHQWQSVGAGSQGPVRFAEPVFTGQSGTDSRNAPDLGGDAGSQAGQQRNRPGDGAESPLPSARPARATPSSAATESDAAPSSPVSSTRLQTFA